jgi:hypothetical protein
MPYTVTSFEATPQTLAPARFCRTPTLAAHVAGGGGHVNSTVKPIMTHAMPTHRLSLSPAHAGLGRRSEGMLAKLDELSISFPSWQGLRISGLNPATI